MNGFRLKHHLKTKTIRTNLILWFLIVSIVPLGVGMTITYTQQRSAMEQEAINKLVAIRDLKVQQVEKWLSDRIGNLHTLGHENELVILEDVFNNIVTGQNEYAVNENIHRIINRYLEDFAVYEEIFIINPQNGLVDYSTNEDSEGADKFADVYFTTPMNTREHYISDIYRSTTNHHTMIFSAPVFCTQHNPNNIVGILALRMELDDTLYALLLNKVGLGDTGETLIVNKDVVALNELRWYEDAPLNLTIKAEPAVKAANGETGVVKTLDYRGVEILAAYTHIPEIGWGFIAKQDLSELYAPINNLFRNLVVLFFVFVVILLLIVSIISRRMSEPIVLMSNNAQKIKSGDLQVRNDIHTGNELEILAESINSMADSLEFRIAAQKSIVLKGVSP